MTDEDLFTTFVTAVPEQMINAVEAMLAMPWNTGAEATLERTVEGMTVTSIEDFDCHLLDVIASTDLSGDTGERLTAAMEHAAPRIVSIEAALTAAWGEPGVLRQAEDLRACTFFEVIMDGLGIDEVLSWQRDERYIIFSAGIRKNSEEYAAAFFVVSRSTVEDVAYDISPEADDADTGSLLNPYPGDEWHASVIGTFLEEFENAFTELTEGRDSQEITGIGAFIDADASSLVFAAHSKNDEAAQLEEYPDFPADAVWSIGDWDLFLDGERSKNCPQDRVDETIDRIVAECGDDITLRRREVWSAAVRAMEILQHQGFFEQWPDSVRAFMVMDGPIDDRDVYAWHTRFNDEPRLSGLLVFLGIEEQEDTGPQQVTTREIVSFMDRYGHEIESDLTLEHFAQLLDSIADTGPDEDWRDVAISDSDDWCVNFTPESITFLNVEDNEDEGRIRPVTREIALTVARDFLRGDLAAIRARLS